MDWFVQSQIKLEPKELFKETWRQSGLVLFWRLLGPLLLAVILVALFVLAASAEGLIRQVIRIALLPLSLATLIAISVIIVLWYVHIYVLTNRRLIHRKGIILRSRVEVQLSRVQNASYVAETVQKWVGLGTVKVETASVGPALVIRDVRSALGIAQRVLAAAEQAKRELVPMDENQVRRLLSARLSQGA